MRRMMSNDDKLPRALFPVFRTLLPLLILSLMIVIMPVEVRAMASGARQTPISAAEMLQHIQSRQGTWIGLKSSLEVRFTTKEGASGACHGELNYQRLDEKLLLRCFDDAGTLLFAFRTDDQYFELYLTEQSRLYSGNIFDLEDTQRIDSQLKPLSLYRALKNMSYPVEQSAVESTDGDTVTLIVYGRGQPPKGIIRRFESTYAGDVKLETFYDRDGLITTTIRRSDFGPGGAAAVFSKQQTSFPRKVEIENKNSESSETDKLEFIFKTVDFSANFKPSDWQLSTPQGTERIVLGTSYTAGFRDGLSS